MRICYVISTPSAAGGANRSLLELIPYVQSAGYECCALMSAHGTMEDALRDLGVHCEVILFGTSVKNKEFIKTWGKRIVNIRSRRLIRDYFVREKVDLVHNNSLPTAIGMDVALAADIPYICHIRENVWTGLGMQFYNPRRVAGLIQHADAVITISDYIKQAYLKFAPNSKYVTLRDGVESEAYFDKRDIFCSDQVTMCIVGVINPQKGQGDAVKALKILRKRGIKNLRLKIIGDDGRWKDSTEYALRLREYVKKMKLDPYIEFIPAIMDPKELKNARHECDINLICSRAEGLGRTTIESMLSGALTIAADAGATPEVIEDGKTGILYQPGNAVDLADHIQEAIRCTDRSRQIARQGQLEALETYCSSKYGERICELYEAVMNAHR